MHTVVVGAGIPEGTGQLRDTESGMGPSDAGAQPGQRVGTALPASHMCSPADRHELDADGGEHDGVRAVRQEPGDQMAARDPIVTERGHRGKNKNRADDARTEGGAGRRGAGRGQGQQGDEDGCDQQRPGLDTGGDCSQVGAGQQEGRERQPGDDPGQGQEVVAAARGRR